MLDLPTRLVLVCAAGLALFAIYVGISNNSSTIGIMMTLLIPALISVPAILYGRWLSRTLRERNEKSGRPRDDHQP
jgi:hypothetical protein